MDDKLANETVLLGGLTVLIAKDDRFEVEDVILGNDPHLIVRWPTILKSAYRVRVELIEDSNLE